MDTVPVHRPVERPTTPRPLSAGRPLAIAAAAALALATGWMVLIDQSVTVPEPPAADAQADVEVVLERHYAWIADTLPQQRASLILLAAGLLGLAVVAVLVASGTASVLARLAAIGVAGGASLWVVSAVAQAGVDRGVELLAASDLDIEAVNAVAFASQLAGEWLRAAAGVAVGAGLLAFAWAAWRRDLAATPGWAAWTALAAVATAALGIVILVPEWSTLLLALAVGGVIIPCWLAWTGLSLLGRDHDGEAGR